MSDSSDRPLLDLIRRQGPMTVAEMVEALGVTPTAIRNRLTRLVGSGMVERRAETGHRGRPQTHLSGERRGSQEARPKLRRPGRRPLGRADAGRRGPQAPPDSCSWPGDRPPGQSSIGARFWAMAGTGGWLAAGTILHCRGVEAEVTRGDGGLLPVLRQHSCPTSPSPRWIERSTPWNGKCSRRFPRSRAPTQPKPPRRVTAPCDFEAKPIVEPRRRPDHLTRIWARLASCGALIAGGKPCPTRVKHRAPGIEARPFTNPQQEIPSIGAAFASKVLKIENLRVGIDGKGDPVRAST